MFSIKKFNVRLLNTNENYGIAGGFTADKPMVEFYDSRYDFTPYGQFINRYYLDTVLDHDTGLVLHGGVSEWTLSSNDMILVREYLKSVA